jgi:proteasome lid subunit RPN8/RPN11
MDPDIQFGEVEELRPEPRRRPDRDRHFAVCTYGTPAEGDLPIFIDVDVLADIEAHAQSDPDVELGGVLLGGQFKDQDGSPFVLVVDSLRAQHYENSRGHFKFTHDTWTHISRQRDEFSDDLQMVGWYHTHPNWGVFLSGMDRFICENFFNRPLDVALVVDPLRGDRGWFYWDHGGREKLPRVKGFSVIASRFRRRELQTYVALLQEGMIMTTERLAGGAPPGTDPRVTQQVVHTIRPQLGWIGTAIIAMLVLQVCTTLLVALRIGTPASGDLASREQRLAGREEAVEKLLGHVEVDPDGKLNVESWIEEYQALRDTEVLLAEAAGWIEKDREELKAEISRLKESERLNEKLQEEIGGLKTDNTAAKETIAQLQKQLDEATKDEATEDEATWTWTWANMVAAGVALLVFATGAALIVCMMVRRRRLT